MNVKIVLSFVAGLAVGAIIGVLATREKYAALANEEIESVKEVFTDRIREANEDEKATRDAYEELTSQYETREEAISVEFHPKKKEYSPTERAGAEKVDYEAFGKTPYVISLEEYSSGKSHFDKINLNFYEDDSVLLDENEEILDDVARLVGDALDRFGDMSEDPEVVYVRNIRLSTDYEIVRLSKSYSETVLGITPKPSEEAENEDSDDEEDE